MKTIDPKALERVEQVLREASIPLTIRALSRRLRVPYSTAKRRLDALDVRLKKMQVREGQRGAKSVAYALK
jgi:response regulator of citrate/malate metabolism